MNEDRTGDSSAKSWQNVLAFVILIGAFLASVIWVYVFNRVPETVSSDGKKIIRVAHFIADDDVQNALDKLARDYEKIRPDVRVIVQTIPERAYKQWATTQCLGGTAPDLMQAQGSWDQQWALLATRYMVPLTPYVNLVNPHNDGTTLDGQRWRDTYADGLRSGYWFHLTEFYSIPFTAQTSRVFYNRDLFKAATGSDDPPKDFRDWMNICEKIKEYTKSTETIVFPMACSSDVIMGLFSRYYCALCEGMVDKYDTCYWSGSRVECTLFALYTDTFTFKQPRVEAPFKMIKEIATQCQPGYATSTADQTRFLFIQGKAGMVLGNVRDARIFRDAARFEVGVFNYPLPSKDDPDYGRYVVARQAETLAAGMHFCLTQRSRYPEIAIDFLQFCTSERKNEEFNADLHWYPVIKTAKSLDYLSAFRPVTEGASYRVMCFASGLPQVSMWFEQQMPLYLDGQTSFDEYMTGLEEMWLTKGTFDFVERDRLFREALGSAERNIGKSQAQMLFEEAGEFKAGQTLSARTNYQLALETMHLLEQGISVRAYTWHHLQKGDYPFP